MTRHNGCILILSLAATTAAEAQLTLNEANAVGAEKFVEVDFSKPYEGFDYGSIPHSGNNNLPFVLPDPGNPFSPDPPVPNPLPNGWKGDTGLGRVLGNGGDWFELVVTEDFTDLRGYTLYWENDDYPEETEGDGVVGAHPDERGFVKFSQDPIWTNLRAGTIITLSEDDAVAEIRDDYPYANDGSGVDDTGYVYDLSTDTSYDPIGIGTPTNTAEGFDADWHIHFYVNEDNPGPYFETGSEVKVDNDLWRLWIFDSTNTNPVNDKTTGLVQTAIGEAADGWGDNLTGNGAGGVNSEEAIALRTDPANGLLPGHYEDIDFTTFGAPNLFNVSTEAYPDGAQDFSTLRAWLTDTLYGDTDYNGDVDNEDVNTVIGNFGDGSNQGWASGSFDADGDVENTDIGVVFGNFGAAEPLTADSENRADLIYNVLTGEVVLDASDDVFGAIINFVLETDGEFLHTGSLANPFTGNFLTASNSEVSASDPTAAPGSGGLAIIELGVMLDAGLTHGQVQTIFSTMTYVGALGSGVNTFDIVLALTGDLNGDGFVGVDDLNLVLANWNQNVTAGDLAAGDASGDGFIGVDDLNLVLTNWNNGTPPGASANIPEPMGLTLLGLGSLALHRRHTCRFT